MDGGQERAGLMPQDDAWITISGNSREIQELAHEILQRVYAGELFEYEQKLLDDGLPMEALATHAVCSGLAVRFGQDDDTRRAYYRDPNLDRN
jgi:hypothetical protein